MSPPIFTSLNVAVYHYLQGDQHAERAACQLFNTLWPQFVRRIQRWGQPLAIAEEIASEAIMKVLHKTTEMRNAVAFEAWANKVLRNTFLSHIRDTKQERSYEFL